MAQQRTSNKPMIPKDFFIVTDKKESVYGDVTIPNIKVDDKYYKVNEALITFMQPREIGSFGWQSAAKLIKDGEKKNLEFMLSDLNPKFPITGTMKSGEKTAAFVFPLNDPYLEHLMVCIEQKYYSKLKMFSKQKYGKESDLSSCMPHKYGIMAEDKRPKDPLINKIKLDFYKGGQSGEWFAKNLRKNPTIPESEKERLLRESVIYTENVKPDGGIRIMRFKLYNRIVDKKRKKLPLTEEDKKELADEKSIYYTHENLNSYISPRTTIDRILIQIKGFWINKSGISVQMVAKIIYYTPSSNDDYDMSADIEEESELVEDPIEEPADKDVEMM